MPNGRETWSRFVTLSMNKYAVAELFHPVTDGRPSAIWHSCQLTIFAAEAASQERSHTEPDPADSLK
jgi:hypothetical protein